MHMEIKLNNLGFKSLQSHLISDLCLSFQSEKRIAIYGSAGAGKTVLLLMLGGFLKPSQGSIFVDGVDIYKSKSYRRHVGLGEVKSVNSLVEEMTPRENIEYFAGINGVKDIKGCVDGFIGKLDLGFYADTPISNVRPLVRSLTALACALVTNPQLLFLDDPSGMLVEEDAEKFWAAVDANLDGRHLFFSTKSRREAVSHADRIIDLNANSII